MGGEPAAIVVIAAMIVGLLVTMMVFAIPWYAISTYHRRKMEEIRGKHRVDIEAETRAAIEALRQEMAALRDTSTQYDVSFDTALNRLDSRMSHLEQRVRTVEQEVDSVHART
jgi:hypothetical protein